MKKIITNKAEFLAAVEAETESIWKKYLFKYTSCGCCGMIDDAGIHISGYAEGSDAECPDHFLAFPFALDDYERELDIADREGCELWEDANCDVWENLFGKTVIILEDESGCILKVGHDEEDVEELAFGDRLECVEYLRTCGFAPI